MMTEIHVAKVSKKHPVHMSLDIYAAVSAHFPVLPSSCLAIPFTGILAVMTIL
jgi:hypothetical protein